MADQVKITVTANTGDAARNLDQIRISAADLKAAMADSSINAATFGSALRQLTTEQNNNAQATKGAADALSEVGEGLKKTASGAGEAEEKTKDLNFATSGAIQEYIRLGHEAMTGNFSRMPGSLVVLASRMGGLTAETLGAVTAFGAAAGAIGYIIYQELAWNGVIEQTHERLVNLGQGTQFTKTNLEDLYKTLQDNTNLSRGDIDLLVNSLGRLRGMSPDVIKAIALAMQDFSTAEGGAKAATADLVRLFDGSRLSAQEAGKAFPNLKQAMLDTLNVAKESGDINQINSAALSIINQQVVDNTERQDLNALKTEERNAALAAGVGIEYNAQTATIIHNDAVEQQNQKLLLAKQRILDVQAALQAPGEKNLVDTATDTKGISEFIAQIRLKRQIENYNFKSTEAEMEKNLQDLKEYEAAEEQHITQLRLTGQIDAYNDRQREEGLTRSLKDLEEYETAEKLHNSIRQEERKIEEYNFRQTQVEMKKNAELFTYLSRQEVQQNRRNLQEMTQYEHSFVSNVLSERMGLGRALMNLSGQIIEKEISDDMAYLTAKLLMNDEEAAAEGAAAKAGFLLHKLLSIANIGVDAVAAGAGVTAHDAPMLGPFSLITGAAAAASVAALVGSLPSFAVGSWNVPHDMTANIHKGEMIVPASQAESVRGGGMGTTVVIQALDSSDVHRWVSNNSRALAKAVSDHQRFNPSTRGNW